MKIRVVAAALLVLPLLAAAAAPQNPGERLREAVLNVVRAQADSSSKPDAPVRLDSEIAFFTGLIDSGQMSPAGLSVVSFYRGQAAALVNSARLSARQSADAALARRSLADFDRVIAARIEVAEWGVSIAEAAYAAGGVARNHLELTPQAYAYWDICAQREHAGCLNIMAGARLTGVGGVPVDLQRSLDLHRKVYDTGTEYTCAGAYSALGVSQILYFGAMRQVAVNELEWLKRANALLDELAGKLKTDNPCNRVRFDVAEYLMHLDAGDDRQPLLERAQKRAGTSEEKALVGYLLGRVSEADLRKAAADTRDKDAACDIYFTAAWRAGIRKASALAREYQALMSALGREYCGGELALLKLKYAR